jgi:multiple antibiotic resistance protein
MSVLSAVLMLILIMDPFGNVPFFLSALKQVPVERHRFVIIREMLIALFVLVVFLFLGQPLLTILNISGSALTVSGGVVLMIIATKMVFPSKDGSIEEEQLEGEPFIVPLAIPYIAGPSAMAVLLLIMNREPGRWPEWLLAVFLAWLFSGAVLLFAGSFGRYIPERMFVAMQRLMGLVLVAIAVEMMMTGMGNYIRSVLGG